MAAERQRLFFASWPMPDVGPALGRLAARLPPGLGRLVDPANFHITLVFLGAVSPDQRDALEAAAEHVRAPACVVSLDHFGYWRKPQIVWAGSRVSPPPLLELVSQLRRAATACGLRVDSRAYQAHLTLYRKVRRPPGALPDFTPLSWPVESFCLVESLSLPGGVRYLPRRVWTLKPSAGSASERGSVE